MTNQKNTFKVSDMHCPSCPKLIQMDLEDTNGVISVDANLETKLVTVEFDSDKLNSEDLIKIIKNSGYTAQLL